MSLTFNLADMWEAVLPHVADRTALIVDDRASTYAQLEERANQLADVLAGAGIGPGDHVGCYLYNCPEYIETMLAAFKLRAVPVNVNYRYVDAELRYLFDDADLKVVVHDVEFADRVAAVRGDVPTLQRTIAVGPGGDYDELLAAASPEQKAIERSGDDLYIVYTGGTTGMPKGVVWQQEDAFYACFGGGDYSRQNPLTDPAGITTRIMEHPLVFFPLAPLMHGAAQWTTWAWFLGGGLNILTRSAPRTDYARVWRMITEHKVNVITIIGDAVARPLIDEYLAHRDEYDSSSILSFGSGAVPLSAAGRAEIAEVFPNALINDGYGASETGAQASNMGDGRFTSSDDETTVLDPATRLPVVPGSGQVGRIARRGHIPLGYYGDPVKTAETFVEQDGVRWVLTGDEAELLEDGSIRMFGRGSMCINSGGEKVYPEEVEKVLVGHPGVYDSLVVGVADPRWGQKVVAVLALAPGTEVGDDELDAHCREQLAAYKLPRAFVRVDEVQRSPSGKADYAWARSAAESAMAAE